VRDLFLAGTLVPLLGVAVFRPFVGVLLWSWISFMNPHRLTWGFATSMPWAVIIFCATAAGCVLAREPRRLRVNAVMVLMVMLMVCITLTSTAALGPAAQVWAKWDRTFKVLVGLLLTAALLDDRRRVHALVWLMVIALGYFGVRGGIFTLVTGGGFIVLGPPDTMIADRNHLSVALLVTIPLMNYLRLHSRHRIVQLGLAAAMVFTLFSVVGSQSRGALVALAATGGMLWLRSSHKLATGLVIVLAVAVAITFMPDSWVERMNTLSTYQTDASAMGRVRIWEASWRFAVTRPLTGGGFLAPHYQDLVNQVVSGTAARAAHSIWFEVLGEHGFPTFAVWLSIIITGVVFSMRIVRLTRDRAELKWAHELARMAQVSIVAYVVGGSFLSLGYWDFFWTLIVVLGATLRLVTEAVAGQQEAAAAPAAGGWRMLAGQPAPQTRPAAARRALSS
jgi:probable O-glycosylation ligase (exosortase A-associated)